MYQNLIGKVRVHITQLILDQMFLGKSQVNKKLSVIFFEKETYGKFHGRRVLKP